MNADLANMNFRVTTGVAIVLRDQHNFDVIDIEKMPEAVGEICTNEVRLTEIAVAILNYGLAEPQYTLEQLRSFDCGEQIDELEDRVLTGLRNFFSRRKREVLKSLLEEFDRAMKKVQSKDSDKDVSESSSAGD